MEDIESVISGGPEYLARKGFADPAKAAFNLRAISEGADERLVGEVLPALVHHCSPSADPDACLNGFERICGAFEDRAAFLALMAERAGAVKVLSPLLAQSRFLVRFILSDPENLIDWLTRPETLDAPRDRESLKKELLSLCPGEASLEEASARLRRFKYREFLRITARDLPGLAGIPETTAEISNLADAALEAACRAGRHALERQYGVPRYKTPSGKTSRCPFTVIAMGKLGGRELNFSSDIDIMFLYGGDGNTSGPSRITNHQYFLKLSEIIIKLIGENTSEGFVFRVDTRLRPEGERGDLAQSLAGYETYYESWGRAWERAALIKARACAGDMELGRRFIEAIRPFVFRKHLDYSAIAELRDLKLRIEKPKPRDTEEYDVKLGPGGIREIEFFVSILQLVYGGREPGIREQNLLRALHRLSLAGLITFDEHNELATAYTFLRTAEHRLQVVDERQTHSFPGNENDIRMLARRMGYRDSDKDAGKTFLDELAKRTAKVREIYDRLFMEQPDDVHEIYADRFGGLLSDDITGPDAVEIFRSGGFRDPHLAYRNFVLLKDGAPQSPLSPRSRNLFLRILPELLAGCVDAPAPDMALNHLESFIASFGSREAIYDLVSKKPSEARRITRLLGASEYFSHMLISRPEMAYELLFLDIENLRRTRTDMSGELDISLFRAESFAARLDVLRSFKHSEELRTGIRDIFAGPDWFEVSRELTTLAEIILEAALSACVREMREKSGIPQGTGKYGGIAVIGLGKLGASELIYGSDLDISFVRAEHAQTDFFDRLSERLIFAMTALTREGAAYQADMRLRPGGSRGMLTNAIGGLAKYYATAPVWEIQALIRARGVAGDSALIERFERTRLDVLLAPRDRDRLKSEILTMRKRLERKASAAKGMNIKSGMGGIMDVEFAVQYLQLLHCRRHPDLLVPGTIAALDMIIDRRLIPDDAGKILRDAYFFMKELESHLRMIMGTADTTLPSDEEKLALIAARMGYDKRVSAMIDDYRKKTGRIREIFDRIFS